MKAMTWWGSYLVPCEVVKQGQYSAEVIHEGTYDKSQQVSCVRLFVYDEDKMKEYNDLMTQKNEMSKELGKLARLLQFIPEVQKEPVPSTIMEDLF